MIEILISLFLYIHYLLVHYLIITIFYRIVQMITRPSKNILVIVTIMVFIIVPALILSISFWYPGRLHSVDKLRYSFCKVTIEKVVNVETDKFEGGWGFSKRYTQNAISFNELKPHLNKLKPGAVLITSHGKSVCALIPGLWKHTMIYLGCKEQTKAYFGEGSSFYQLLKPYYKTNNEYLMIDASFRQDVAIRCISNMANLNEVSTLRAFLCLEPKLSKQENLEYIYSAVNELGKRYDLTFDDTNSDEYYCTEIIANSLSPYGIRFMKQSKIFMRNIMLPDDMVDNILEKRLLELFNYKYCLVKETDSIKTIDISQLARLSEHHFLN